MIKVGTIKTVARLFETEMVPSKSKQLFSFATKHRLKTPKGKLSEDGMILTHMSNFVPRNGFIDTARSGVGMARDSVHFAVNHGVNGHLGGNWANSEYAVLMPFGAARETAGNRFVGGIAADFYSKGRVRIPKGSVIVRRSTSVPDGQYRISDAAKIDEFKDLHGVKIIETSSTDMKATVDNVVQRLGYRVKQGNVAAGDWGGGKDFNLFNSYLRKHGMKPMMHSYTPNGKTEQLIQHLKCRVDNNAEWIIKDKAGKVIIDYQKEYLQNLKYIENFAKKTGFPVDFDTKQIAQIVRTSKTPQEALNLIESRLKFKSMEPLQKNIPELDLLQWFRVTVGGDKAAEITDNIALRFLKKANKKTVEEFANAPSAINSIPDAVIEQACIQNKIAQICKKNGLKFDNGIANKLYELG